MKLPTRKLTSHKGENGRVLVVGGNEIFYGAPIITALAAEKSGVDLIRLILPAAHENAAKTYSLNFIIQTFTHAHFSNADEKMIRVWSEESDVIVIGNGLGKHPDSQKALLKILPQLQRKVVLDGEALIPDILNCKRNGEWLITPHEGEFQRVFQCAGTEKNVKEMAIQHNLCIVKKGQFDCIGSASGELFINRTGTPAMTVGGTGDALAGLIAGFLAQGESAPAAAKIATYFWGKCGELLEKKQKNFTAQELLNSFPETMHKLAD